MRTLFLLILLVTLPRVISAQDLETKLNQTADFTPSSSTVREQLIEVAQHYKVPMGIEWVLERDEKKSNRTVSLQATVRTLLNTILQSAPNYSLTVRNGVVHISDNRYTADSRNFLNLRIREFKLSKANVFDATAVLRSSIHRTLHPERFVGGMNGGYGYGAPAEGNLDKQNISFAGKDLTVREILDHIVASNGNTLWIVNIAPSTIMKDEAFYAQFEPKQEIDFYWKIITFEE